MTERAIEMMAQGRTVDMRILMDQLSTEACVLSLVDDEPTERDPAGVYRNCKDSVVVVGGIYRCDNCSRWHCSIASGFVISTDGAVVTNYHVVDSPEKQTLVVMTADQHVYAVQRVLAASRADDLAILQIEGDDLPALAIAAGRDEGRVGSPVSVISHPDGRFYTCTDGIVSRHMRIDSAGRLIDAVAITADYARGSSGAPVLNRQGTVVAVVSSTESIYYSQEGARQRDLQMVLKTCIPSMSLLRLIASSNDEDAELTAFARTEAP